MIRQLLLQRLGILIWFAAGCAGAATTAADTPAAVTEPAAGEQLIAQPPAGWRQIGSVNTERLKRAEFVPAGDDAETWDRRITFESIVAEIGEPLPDPIKFVELITAGRDRDCGTFSIHHTFAGIENGYPSAVDLLICHKDRDTDRSKVTMMKTIQGNDAFYVIARSLRDEPIPKDEAPSIEEAEIGGWAVFLKSVSLCDTDRAAHPCPPPSE